MTKKLLFIFTLLLTLEAKDYLIGFQYATGTVNLNTTISQGDTGTDPLPTFTDTSKTDFDNGALLLAYKVQEDARLELEIARGIKVLKSFYYEYQMLSYVMVNESPDIEGISLLLGVGAGRLGIKYKAPFNEFSQGLIGSAKLGISLSDERHTLELGAKRIFFSPETDTLKGVHPMVQTRTAEYKFSNLAGNMIYINYLYEL